MKLQLTVCAALFAMTSALAAAHPHQVPAPPAPPAAPALPAPPAMRDLQPPAAPALPDLPAPPAPPAPPPPPAIEIPDDVLAACEGKADGARVDMTASNGARIAGTCRKRGNVYAFMLKSYKLNRSSR